MSTTPMYQAQTPSSIGSQNSNKRLLFTQNSQTQPRDIEKQNNNNIMTSTTALYIGGGLILTGLVGTAIYFTVKYFQDCDDDDNNEIIVSSDGSVTQSLGNEEASMPNDEEYITSLEYTEPDVQVSNEEDEELTNGTELDPLPEQHLLDPHTYDRYAILIGLDHVGTSNELYGCSRDAYHIAQHLQHLGYRIQLYVDRHLPEEEALLDTSKVNVQVRGINALSLSSLMAFFRVYNAPNALFYFHISSHGTYVDDQNGDEADGQDEVLMMSNSFIRDDDLRRHFVEIQPQGHLLCTFDTCHSGSIADFTRNDVNISCISACMDSQTAAEYGGLGAFTRAWVQILDNFVDTDGRLAMTYRELDTYLKASVTGQEPVITTRDFGAHVIV